MKNPFLWLSGADTALIDKCGDSAHTERNKFIGFGTTVIIPAVFGGLAAGYAISTFIDFFLVYFLGGILWFFTILAIDRFLVSTLYKSRIHSAISFKIALFVRLVLAVVLGFVISHPLVMFVFKDAIEKQVVIDHANNYTESIGKIKQEINDKFQYEIGLINTKQATLECKKDLVVFERTGAKKTLACGSTSGKVGVSVYTDKLETEINKLESELIKLRSELKEKISGYQTGQDSITTHFENGATLDYIARTKALQKLTEKEPHIWWANTLLIFALVLVDSLLVILKATTPIGQYELEKDKLYKQAEILSDAEILAYQNHSANAYKEVVELKLLADAIEKKMNAPRDLLEKFVNNEPTRMRRFENSLKIFGKDRFNDVLELRELYLDAYKNATEKFKGIFKS